MAPNETRQNSAAGHPLPDRWNRMYFLALVVAVFFGSLSITQQLAIGDSGAGTPDRTDGVMLQIIAACLASLAFVVRRITRRIGRSAVEIPAETPRSILDPLTKLPARASFLAELEKTLERTRRKRESIALVMLDFNSVEFTGEVELAQNAPLLLSLARVLRGAVSTEHAIGHMRECEFAVLVRNRPSVSEVEHLADHIVDTLRTTPLLEGRQKYIAPIVGVGFSSDSQTEMSQLLRNANIALGRARSSGRAHYIIVDQIRLTKVS